MTPISLICFRRRYVELRCWAATRDLRKFCTLSLVDLSGTKRRKLCQRLSSGRLVAGSLRKQFNNVTVVASGGPRHPEFARAVAARVG